MEKGRAKNIVIIGGGFGGLSAALSLTRLKRKDISITLIDKKNFHCFPPGYYKALSAPFSDSRAPCSLSFEEIRPQIAFPFEEILKRVHFIHDEVIGADLENKKIRTAKSGEIPFDYLIAAPGSKTDFPNPAIQKYALELKTPQDALNIRNAVDELFWRKAKHEVVRIIIGGGGFTGCELAAELIGLIKYFSKIHGHPVSNSEICLLEASKTILEGIGSWLQKRAKKRLEKLGVKILTSGRVLDVKEHEIFLEGGKSVNYDIFIWTAGVKANHLTEMLFSAKGGSAFGGKGKLMDKGRVKVDECLRFRPYENVFLVGDIVYRINPRNKRPAPMTAYAAVEQGKYAAKAIKRLLSANKPRPYHYSGNKFIIPLGGKYALFDFGWLKIEGYLAWLIRQFVILRYLKSLKKL